MSSIWESHPADTRYVLEERCDSLIVGCVEFAIVDECRDGNLMQAGYARPIAKGSGTIQRGSACSRSRIRRDAYSLGRLECAGL